MVTQLDLFYSLTIITGDAKDCRPKFADVLMACSVLLILVWLGSSSLIASQTSKMTAILCVAISKLYNRKLTFLLQPKRRQDFYLHMILEFKHVACSLV